jgi:PST family polysaccharide transporter
MRAEINLPGNPAESGTSSGSLGAVGDRESAPVPSIGLLAVHGVLWTYLSAAGSKILIFVATVILARVLLPVEFGQVGFALVVISYLDTVGDLGVSSALIYERDKPEEAANVTFIVSIAMGLLWFAIAFAGAPLIADFFNDPAVVPILRVMAFVFVIKALGNTHDALLRRDLAFKKKLIPDFAMAALKGLCSVGLAFAGWGVWSLVLGQLIGALAATVALWAVVPWRPTFRATWKTSRRMLSYSSKIMSVDVVSAVVYNADYVIVGRILGSAALGFYTLAYRTPELLISMIVWVIGKVTFPVYSKLREDPAELRGAFLVTVRYLSLVTLPAGFGLAAVGALFVSALYGDRWVPAAWAMQALAMVLALRSLGSHAGDVYKATGHTNILVALGVLRGALLIPAMIWGARYGILGVAVGQLIVTAASTILSLYVAARFLSLSSLSLLREIKTAVVSTAVMIAVLQLLMPQLSAMGPVLGLSISVCVGASVYAAMIWFTDRDAIELVRTTLFGKVGAR